VNVKHCDILSYCINSHCKQCTWGTIEVEPSSPEFLYILNWMWHWSRRQHTSSLLAYNTCHCVVTVYLSTAVHQRVLGEPWGWGGKQLNLSLRRSFLEQFMLQS